MCLKDWTVAWKCNTKNASSPHRRRHHARASFGSSPGEPHSPIIHQSTNGLGTKWVVKLETLDANHDAEHPIATSGRDGTGRVRKTATLRRRKPTPLQTARWKAVQKAKRKGLSIRGIARELGIHRDTVRKYMNAESPPLAPSRLTPNDP